jgi:hypothetical protein
MDLHFCHTRIETPHLYISTIIPTRGQSPSVLPKYHPLSSSTVDVSDTQLVQHHHPSDNPVKMSFQSKILRTANAPNTPPTEIEQQIAQALLDLETNVPDLKSELRQLQISAAKEVDVKGGKKAVVIFVPVPQVKAFHKVQQR